MSAHHKKALGYIFGGILAAITVAWLMLVTQYSVLLNVHGQFGPDGESWSVHALPMILIVIIFAIFFGAFSGYGVCLWRSKRLWENNE